MCFEELNVVYGFINNADNKTFIPTNIKQLQYAI